MVNFKNILILSLFFFLFFISETFAASKIKMGWESWTPFQYQDANGNYSGVDLVIAKQIAKKAGIKIEFINMPWKRLIHELNRGNMDLAGGGSKTPERERFINFSKIPYRSESMVLWIRKGQKNKYNLKSIQDIMKIKFTLGTTRGYFYGEKFEKLLKYPDFESRVQVVSIDELNIKKLVHKRLDGVLLDPYVAKGIFEKNNVKGQLEKYPMPPVFSSNIYFMFSKKAVSEDIFNKFNNTLLKMKKDGSLQSIIDQYTK